MHNIYRGLQLTTVKEEKNRSPYMPCNEFMTMTTVINKHFIHSPTQPDIDSNDCSNASNQILPDDCQAYLLPKKNSNYFLLGFLQAYNLKNQSFTLLHKNGN